MTTPSQPVQPAPTVAPVKPISTGLAVTIVVLVLAAVGIVIAIVATRPKPQSIRACEAWVSDRLIAPSTAHFSGEIWSDDDHEVSGDVDAQNSFGAQVRSHFSCAMTHGPDGWTVTDGTTFGDGFAF